MRGAYDTIQLLRPRSAKEAVRAYGRKPHAIPLAGGTDFMVSWNAGHLNRKTVLDIGALKEWTGIRSLKNSLRIGSLATHTQLREHDDVQRKFPLLVEACAMVGGIQIQNRGTLGGNIANASPAGDTFPPLAVYQPVLHVIPPKGRRTIPFSKIFAGVKKTTLGPSELIESIEMSFLTKRPTRQIFRKVGTRAAQAISKTVAAGLLWLGQGSAVRELRFSLGSMAPTVRRLRAVEAYVAGKRLNGKVVREACELLKDDVSPIDDLRSTRDYRIHVSQNILRSFLEGTRDA